MLIKGQGLVQWKGINGINIAPVRTLQFKASLDKDQKEVAWAMTYDPDKITRLTMPGNYGNGGNDECTLDSPGVRLSKSTFPCSRPAEDSQLRVVVGARQEAAGCKFEYHFWFGSESSDPDYVPLDGYAASRVCPKAPTVAFSAGGET